VLDQLLADKQAPPPPVRTPAQGIKRKTAVQKVINLALHFPRAAAQVADVELLAVLNQPGADLLRRVCDAAVRLRDANTARLLENLRGDPDLQYLERIVAEPPLGIEDEAAAATDLKESIENLRKDALKAASVERIKAHVPGS
jgi:DNA primase